MAVMISVVLGMLLFLCSSVLGQTTYSKTCPNVESITRDTIRDAYNKDKTVPAGLLRLHFHDCFVDGCDGSILLSSTPLDGKDVERFALGNNNSVRGFEVIDQIKTKLEAACPGAVSCSDIVAMAARDAGVFMNGPYYTVPTGRYDGTRSNRTLADSRLPSPFAKVSELLDNFNKKGLSLQDLVVLSGGHTIGRSKCSAFEERVYSADSGLNPEYVAMLKNVCKPRGANPSPTNPLDKDSEFSFDNTYYRNLMLKNGLLTSDSTLLDNGTTAALVKTLANDNSRFFQLYAQSMIKMGNMDWKTSKTGEIRKKCSVVNTKLTTVVGDIAY